MATGRIGTTPVLQVRWSKAPSAGTTSLSGLDDNSVSLVYSVGYEAVYRNGVLLSRTNDYTATNGTTITLIDATIAGDIIEVFANQTIPLADTYSQTVANGKFINNTLTTTTGDIIYASAANTPARLAIGSTDQVLKVSGGIPAWGAAPAGMTQLATGSMSGTTTSITGISGSYKNLELIIRDPGNSSSDGTPAVRINGDTSGVYGSISFTSAAADVAATATSFGVGYHENVTDGIIKIVFTDYANTSTFKMIESRNFSKNTGTNIYGQANWGLARITSAITEINLIWQGGQTWNAGTYILYGVS